MTREVTTARQWIIAIAGTLIMTCLGTVYAWSFFQKPLCEAYGWSNTVVAWVFSLAICSLGLAAAVGGLLLPKAGPTRFAVIGGICFGTGYLVSSLALSMANIPLLYLGYGLIGGSGLGLGYVIPVATVAK
jgi:OFA family oxalate/formate antiporter-like MFS transporter